METEAEKRQRVYDLVTNIMGDKVLTVDKKLSGVRVYASETDDTYTIVLADFSPTSRYEISTFKMKNAYDQEGLEKIMEHIEKYIKRRDAYGKGLSDYIKRTGGHRGNPVYMD